MTDRRYVMLGLTALPVAAALPAVRPSDPFAALWAEARALRAILADEPEGPAWDAAYARLAALDLRALETHAASLDGAAAAVSWARAEFVDQVQGPDGFDLGERLVLALLDTALAALRRAAPPIV